MQRAIQGNALDKQPEIRALVNAVSMNATAGRIKAIPGCMGHS
jgi:hypothetical protein